MYGFKKGAGKAERKSFANGGAVDDGAKAPTAARGSGMVRGPGTGTSDDVKDAVPPGTYIMPADSTQEIGPEALGAAGFRPGSKPKAPNIPGMGFGASAQVPVNLSNGEFRLSPEQVHAIGVQVLEGMKAATHTPAGEQGDNDGDDASTRELFFADGGLVDDPNKRRPLATSPTNTYPGNQAERAGNIYAQANADLARGFGAATSYLNRGDPVKDAASAVGGFFADSAAKARQPNAWDDSGTKPQFAAPAVAPNPATPPAATAQAAPTSAPTAAAPASSAVSQDAKTGVSMDPTPPNSGPVPYTVTPVENTNGVQRINQPGKSPLFTNIDPGQAVAEMKGNPVGGFQPAAGGVGGPDVLGILQRESQIRAGMGELQDRINFNGGNGIGFRKTGTDEAIRDMLVKGNSRDRASALGFAGGNRDAEIRGAQTQQEMALRQQEMQGRQGIANEELGLKREAQGFQTRAQARQEALQSRYEAAKTPEERSAIAQQIRDLGGKEFPNRFTVVPGGQEWDANAGAMRNVPGRVINNQTGLDVERPTQGAGQQPQAMPADKAQRKAGMVYVLADGRRVKWDGTGATEVK